MGERTLLRKQKPKKPALDRPLPNPRVLAAEPANNLLFYQQNVGNLAVQQLLGKLPVREAEGGDQILRAGLVQRAPPDAGASPTHVPPSGQQPRILSLDERVKTISEVGLRIADVARKWTLAIAMQYTDKKTEPDLNLWGPLFEALFTFAGGWIGGLVVPSLAKALNYRGVGEFLRKLPEGSAATLAQVEEGATKTMEGKFKNIHDAMLMGVGYWVKDKARIKASGNDLNGIATQMSDMIGHWAETMRREYITNTPDNAEGDLALLAAEELFAADNHSQSMYNQRVAADWDRIEKKDLPVLRGEVGNVDEEDVQGDENSLATYSYELKLATIVNRAYQKSRVAVVYQFIMINPRDHEDPRAPLTVPSGQYAYKEWADDALEKAYHNSKKVRAKKNPLTVDMLVNAGHQDLLNWVMGD